MRNLHLGIERASFTETKNRSMNILKSFYVVFVILVMCMQSCKCCNDKSGIAIPPNSTKKTKKIAEKNSAITSADTSIDMEPLKLSFPQIWGITGYFLVYFAVHNSDETYSFLQEQKTVDTIPLSEFESKLQVTSENAKSSGVRIYYGLDTTSKSNRVVLIYQKVDMVLSHISAYGNIGTFNISGASSYYIQQHGTFSLRPLPADTFKRLTDTYRDRMVVYKEALNQYVNLIINDNDVTSDPRCIVFPWMEMQLLIDHNSAVYQHQQLAKNIKARKFIDYQTQGLALQRNDPPLRSLIISCAAESIIYGNDVFNYKHTIALRSFHTIISENPEEFTNMGANFGGLCPPNCNIVSYIMAITN